MVSLVIPFKNKINLFFNLLFLLFMVYLIIGVTSMKKKKRKLKVGRIIFAFILLVLLIIAGTVLIKGVFKSFKYETKYLASLTNTAMIYDSDLKEYKELVRGYELTVHPKNEKIEDDVTYIEIKYEKENYYVKSDNLVDKKHDVVLEDKIYIRSACTVLESDTSSKIMGLAPKASYVDVTDYDKLNDDGSVNMYKISLDDIDGYIYAKYATLNEEEAKNNYNAEELNPIHEAIKNTYGGGVAVNLDFFPNERKELDNNKMPEVVYSLYLNAGSNVISNVDKYIEFAKDTKINAFVVDIKDNTSPAYPSEVMKELSPTNYDHAINSYDNYKNAIKKLKDAGFYVIGRITTFKDDYYVADHPESAMLSTSNSKPYYFGGGYWPNPYNRDVWYFNVELAKEAVVEMGFNEINFDYVRFPDRTGNLEKNKTITFPNTYGEDKAQAIQRYLMYATDEIHKVGAYVSADVFGESSNGSYVVAYGQYWPAISNVVDVISAMPYPDHFANNSYGISKPWNNPYQLLSAWSKEVNKRQDATTSPAVVRTWIQAYDVMEHVDSNGINYNAENVEQEIKALFDNNLNGGYITWLSSSNLVKYQQQKAAFQKDYR